MQDKEFLERKVARNSRIVNDLKNSEAWRLVVEDFQNEKRRIDDSWQAVSDEKVLTEMRIAKLALTQIVNLVAFYEQDLKTATEQLANADSPWNLAEANYGER